MTYIWKAFKKYPCIFSLFETNLDVKIEFFVTKMQRNIKDIIQRPKLFDLSMEKRIIPHFEVAQIIFPMTENVSLMTLFVTPDKIFMQAFDGVHRELVTELLNMKLHLSELEKTKMEFIT